LFFDAASRIGRFGREFFAKRVKSCDLNMCSPQHEKSKIAFCFVALQLDPRIVCKSRNGHLLKASTYLSI